MVFRRFLQGLLGAVSLLCCAVSPVRGQERPSCSARIHHSMDYLIGEWEVKESGATTGFARFTSASMGCAIVEDWMPVAGRPAKGLLFYEPRIEAWRAIQVSSAGVTETREQESGLFVSAERKRRFLKDTDSIAVEETSDGSIRRMVYRKAPSPPASSISEGGCDGPEYRQSEIWLGEWEALGVRDERIELLSVRKALGGCLLVSLRTPVRNNIPRGTGSVGFSFWDPKRAVWREVAVTPAGVDEIEGVWTDGIMRGKSEILTHGASKQMNRVSPRPWQMALST